MSLLCVLFPFKLKMAQREEEWCIRFLCLQSQAEHVERSSGFISSHCLSSDPTQKLKIVSVYTRAGPENMFRL